MRHSYWEEREHAWFVSHLKAALFGIVFSSPFWIAVIAWKVL